jgi:hypothetical protein
MGGGKRIGGKELQMEHIKRKKMLHAWLQAGSDDA